MKRIGFIYEKIHDKNNLYLAYLKAKRGKAWYSEVLEFEKDIKGNLTDIEWDLLFKEYKTSKYEIFEKQCGNKVRQIYKLPFYPDRICQWAIMLQLESIFISKFVRDTYSAIPKRGIHLALNRLKKALKTDVENTQYCLKLDVKKYYPNIDHDILKNKLARIFKDKDLLWLLGEIIDSIEGGKGLPIGNYTSQYLGNFYLSDFDHWLKEVKKVKYMYRYMDDVIILGKSKEELHQLKLEIIDYMRDNLKLELKGNEQVFPVDKRPIDFVGYNVYRTNGKNLHRKYIMPLEKKEVVK